MCDGNLSFFSCSIFTTKLCFVFYLCPISQIVLLLFHRLEIQLTLLFSTLGILQNSCPMDIHFAVRDLASAPGMRQAHFYLVFHSLHLWDITSCISHFSCCCDEILDIDNLREEGLSLKYKDRGQRPM